MDLPTSFEQLGLDHNSPTFRMLKLGLLGDERQDEIEPPVRTIATHQSISSTQGTKNGEDGSHLKASAGNLIMREPYCRASHTVTLYQPGLQRARSFGT